MNVWAIQCRLRKAVYKDMSRQQIAIIDYGMGNLHSVSSAIAHVSKDADVIITSDHSVIADADRVIFPGVGAIRDCMSEIRNLGFDTAVSDVIASGKPMLAICVGMQALMKRSEESGGVECLGHIDGSVNLFANDADFEVENQRVLSQGLQHLKVPHMGWNQVRQAQDHVLWQGIDNNARFYFVHSYFVECTDVALRAGLTEYGCTFTSSIAKENVFAVQFHPEKSHDNGLMLLSNFVQWDGRAR